MYSSNISLTSALYGVGGQRHASAALPLGKTRYSLIRRLSGPQGRSGRVRQISPPPGLDPGPSSPYRLTYLGPLKVKNQKKITESFGESSPCAYRCLTPKIPEFKAAVVAGASHHPVSA
jgi:hypothetical protein